LRKTTLSLPLSVLHPRHSSTVLLNRERCLPNPSRLSIPASRITWICFQDRIRALPMIPARILFRQSIWPVSWPLRAGRSRASQKICRLLVLQCAPREPMRGNTLRGSTSPMYPPARTNLLPASQRTSRRCQRSLSSTRISTMTCMTVRSPRAIPGCNSI